MAERRAQAKEGARKRSRAEAAPGHFAREGLPAPLAEAVAGLNDWTPQPELRHLIQRLCAWKPMTIQDLAEILNRSKKYLRAEYIGPMVRAHELAYTHPEKPNDPRQRYRHVPE